MKHNFLNSIGGFFAKGGGVGNTFYRVVWGLGYFEDYDSLKKAEIAKEKFLENPPAWARLPKDTPEILVFENGEMVSKYAKGGGVGGKMSFNEFKETLREYEIEGGFGKTLEKGYKMYYLPKNSPYLNTTFKHRDKKKAYQEYLKMYKYEKGGGVYRELKLHDVVIYKDEIWHVTERNGVLGIINFSQGAWGSDYPFIPFSKLDAEKITDFYGNKVKFNKGGEVGTHVDLFEHCEMMPENLREIVNRYQDSYAMGEDDYIHTQQFLDEVQAIGYTFDYYLDNEPYGLRPIGVKLNELEGYEDMEEEDEYAKGGKVKQSNSQPKPNRKKKGKKESKVVRGYVDDEPFEYAKGGGVNDSFNWTAMTYNEKLSLVRESGLEDKVAIKEVGTLTPKEISKLKNSIRLNRELKTGKYAKGGGVHQSFKVGDIVELSENGWDNENYHDFFNGNDNVKLVITNVYKSEKEHQGFDTYIGQALYSTKRLDNGQDVPFDLYDWELEHSTSSTGKYAKGGTLNKYRYIPKRKVEGVELKKGRKVVSIDGKDVLNGMYVRTNKYGLGGRVSNIDSEIASPYLKDELKEKMGNGDDVIHFAYTDYGGDFLDKVAIEYFEENYPDNIVSENTSYSGKNAFVFGKPATEWIEQTENYILGFEDFESYYFEKQHEEEHNSFSEFLNDLEKYENYDVSIEALDWLMENKGGYYSVTTTGLDYSSSDLKKELENNNLIRKSDEYAKGGKVHSFLSKAKGFGKKALDKSVELGKSAKQKTEKAIHQKKKDIALGVLSEMGMRKNVSQKEEEQILNPAYDLIHDKYAKGGSLSDDTPKIYVADLAAYNEGKLIGEWIDLSEFDSGSEVMAKIQELLQKWSEEQGENREEVAIHDYENFGRDLYDEYMGEEDFDKIIKAYKISEEKGIPADVIASIMREYDPEDIESWIEENYEGEFDSDTDLAYHYVDMMGGVQGLSKNTLEHYFDYESFGEELAMNDYTNFDGHYFRIYQKGGELKKHNLIKYLKRK